MHLYKDAVEQLFGWSVDVTTGVVTFSTSPAAGVQLTADFEFDVPVRFDTHHMAVTIQTYRLHAWQQIPDRRAQDLTFPAGSLAPASSTTSHAQDHHVRHAGASR